MKNIFIILIYFSFCSCVTERQRLKICNSCAVKTEVRDSIYQVECWDTVRLPPIQGPVIYLESIKFDSIGHLKPFSITLTKNSVKATAKSLGNSIVFTCETDSLKAYIQTLKERFVLNKKHDAEVKFLPCKNERTRFDGFAYWWFWITLAVIVISVLIVFGKKYFNLLVRGK